MAVTTYGPADAPTVLVIHGITGHGRRWAHLAREHLEDVRIVAPDLLGHGHSATQAPWTIEAQVLALIDVLNNYADAPVPVVGHSYGGLLAIWLARTAPERVRSLLLLDPAVGIDGVSTAHAAVQTIDGWYLRDAEHARERKRAEAWDEVSPRLLDAEIDNHLIPTPDGRWQWRLHPGAIVTTWSELARPIVLPPNDIDATLVIADNVVPPVATPDFVDAFTAQIGAQRAVVHADCGHLVPLARPELTATLIREML